MKKNMLAIIGNSKGQVAIFVALLFQVLFVFFAMIVNVGLLVHHKINLQNSVDLAAYYGAMKQAEMLNAIGHVNYQIRQSYKLLTFRYQQFGTAGTTESGQNPYSGGPKGEIKSEKDEPVSYDPAFCLPYTPVDIVLPNKLNENYCKHVEGMKVPLPGVPSFASNTTFNAFQGNFISFANVLRQKSMEYCKYAMTMNWMQLAKFIGAYKWDIRNRKKLLLALANEVSKEDPRDIQGESIKDGAYQTFYRNLTGPNKEGFRDSSPNSPSPGFEFKFLNSFSVGSCHGNPTEVSPPGWLKEIFIFPTYAVFDGECSDSNDSIKFKPVFLNNGAESSLSQNIPPELKQQAQQLADLATEAPSSDPQYLLYRASIGFEKDPWCVGYVGITATATPKIPFSPFGSVKLKATAYAKPFGGRVGPWYGQTWDYSEGSDTKSNDSRGRTDALLPVRVSSNQVIGPASEDQLEKLKSDKRLFPNHSRYLGDKWGVVTELTTGQFAKAIHQKFPDRIRLAWFNQLSDQDMDSKSSQGDILAWDKEKDQTVPMRDLELAAIAPDQFDTATYSIDPDFYNNYVLKIEKGYGNQFQFLIRGDLGSRMQGSEEQKRFSIRNQIQALENPSKNMIDTKEKLTYYLNEFSQVLTSWQQKSPDQYVLDTERFGRCLTQASDPISQNQSDEKFFTMGSCKAGGRTGYSVKLVDGKFLRNEVDGAPTYSLGGQGTSGKIKNPPTDF